MTCRPCQRGRRAALIAVIFAILAVLAANRSGGVPSLVLTMAGVACSGEDPVRMELGVLIQRNHVRCMCGAKDVSTMATMMLAKKEVEV